jgi:hypothetical protein
VRYFCGLTTFAMWMHCSSVAIDECSLSWHNIQYGQKFHSGVPLYSSWNMSGAVWEWYVKAKFGRVWKNAFLILLYLVSI